MCQSRYSRGRRRRRGAFHLRAENARVSDSVGPTRMQVSNAVDTGTAAILSNCWNCCKREVLLSGEICRRASPRDARSVTFGWSCPWKRRETFSAPWLLFEFYGCAPTRLKKSKLRSQPYINRRKRRWFPRAGNRYSSGEQNSGKVNDRSGISFRFQRNFVL